MNELRLNHFLGINFGASPEYAKKKLLTKTGCIFDKKNSSNEVLFFNGLTYDKQNVASVKLVFINKKFNEATVYIKPKLNILAIQNYRKIQSELNSQYFVTNDVFETYEKPYEVNDEHTEKGIAIGKVSYSSHWNFPRRDGGFKDNISLKIAKDFTIIINYEYGGFSDVYSHNQEKDAWATCFILTSFILFLYLFTI